jgi:apolipoprotein D and lipocalin family protein
MDRNKKTNAHWKVSPFWPLKFDYLVIEMDSEKSWVVIGVPNQKYVWIMSRDWNMSENELNMIIARIKDLNYNIRKIRKVPQRW